MSVRLLFYHIYIFKILINLYTYDKSINLFEGTSHWQNPWIDIAKLLMLDHESSNTFKKPILEVRPLMSRKKYVICKTGKLNYWFSLLYGFDNIWEIFYSSDNF